MTGEDWIAIPLPEQIECVEREIRLRFSVYPRLIAKKMLTRENAELEIARMQAVLETLRRRAPL